MSGRRVVRLSRLDRERLERGEIATPEEALHKDDPEPDAQGHKKGDPPSRADRDDSSRLSGRDREILNELPPHFGKY